MLKKPAAGLVRTDVQIWYCATQKTDGGSGDLLARHLSQEERARRDRFRFEEDRETYTVAHDLLRRSLSRNADVAPADWQFAVGPHGKPSIENAGADARALSFNLSYTRGYAACAIAGSGAVGVDIERTGQPDRVQNVAERYFSSSEIAWIKAVPANARNARVIELWTLKEAYLKALGIGLSGKLNDVSFVIDGDRRVDCPAALNSNEWHFALFKPFENVRLAVAVRSAEQPHFIVSEDPDEDRLG